MKNVTLFISVIIVMYLFINSMFQIAGMANFLFTNLIDAPRIISTILGVLFIVLVASTAAKFPLVFIVIFLSTIYLDVILKHHNFWHAFLLNVWPSIIALLYCLYKKRLSVDFSTTKKD
ncbi:TPA: hypothetical protein JD264_09735 [Serratia fonticola]|nr:hypothetical protein [Serratia fonticola]